MKSGEYALSKDNDVALWLHHRAYNKLPPLSDVGDFIIVNTDVHDDFDDFKSKEIEPGYKRMNYCSITLKPSCMMLLLNKYGMTFVRLHASEIDDLCQWVEELHERYSEIGNDIFITGN